MKSDRLDRCCICCLILRPRSKLVVTIGTDKTLTMTSQVSYYLAGGETIPLMIHHEVR